MGLLYNIINDKYKDERFFVCGGVGTDTEEIREIVENETDAIIVAGFQDIQHWY